MNILITGGAGFIGSHVVRRFVKKYPEYKIYNLDKLTYAGNLESIKDLEGVSNYKFLKEDINDSKVIFELFSEFAIDGVIHLAAESHVDRSIQEPADFIKTNIVGTTNLLEAARYYWKEQGSHRFYHISTDEVYGSVEKGSFTEESPYEPRSPYSASKAASDHIVRAYGHTFNLPIMISNCSNNYGSYQFPEKLIPLMIRNISENLPLPVYGKGENVRDWLWVEDHVSAIDLIFHKGKIGETYNVGGGNEWKNIDLVTYLCDLVDRKLGRKEGSSRALITYVKDRAGHDKRYAIDFSKLSRDLGWKPSLDFARGLEITVDWYLANTEWLEHVTSGEYRNYYEKQYHGR